MRKPRIVSKPTVRVIPSLDQVRGGGHVDNPGQTPMKLKQHVDNPGQTPMKDA